MRYQHEKENVTQNHKLEIDNKRHGCLGEIHSGGDDPHRNVVLSKMRKWRSKTNQYIDK